MTRSSHETALQRLTTAGVEIRKENIVEETAVDLCALDNHQELYSFATLLATPTDLAELLAGHIVSEGYISKNVDRDMFVIKTEEYDVVEYHGQLDEQVQRRVVTTSCGACNHPDLLVETIAERTNVSKFANTELDFICDSLAHLTASMTLFQTTGGSHGSGLILGDTTLSFVSEDIGRHNAVDKTIGKAIFSGLTEFDETMLLLSGRCGWDIVAKAARTGIAAIASFGALSSAAIQLAREHNITLFGFVRSDGAWKVGHSAELSTSIDESN